MAESAAENYSGVFGTRVGFGGRPAVLAIDFINAYVEPGAPFYAPGVVEAVGKAGPFYALARSHGVPVIYTRVIYDRPRPDAHVFLTKVPALRALVTGEPLAEIVESVRPAPDDIVIDKQHASAFYGTELDRLLAADGVDTLIVTGCTTSGCIRATVIDAMQYGYRPIVPMELVGDRHDDPHHANLFDMGAKYGDVLPLAEVEAYVASLQSSGG